MDKPIAITPGDPAGIGPEIIAKAFRDAPERTRGCFVAGDVGVMRRAALDRVDLVAALRTQLDWKQLVELDRLAPTHVEVPTGSRIAVDYSEPEAPVLAVRLQELFGASETPHVGGGRVPLTLHLLSPAHRPVQVTRDLAGFWAGSYVAVRKDLRGRYPRHSWPEDPLQAEPTRRAKPR